MKYLAHAAVHAVEHAVTITIFVFAMMLLVDYGSVLSRGRLPGSVRGGRFRQYIGASLLGTDPGCLGSFLSVSLYMRGLLSLGGIVACMVATSGDEAFIMLALFPRQAVLLFAVLFVTGIGAGWISDLLAARFNLQRSAHCEEASLHEEETGCRCFDRDLWLWPWRLCWRRLVLSAVLLGLIVGVALGAIGHEPWVRMALLVLLPASIAIVLTVPEHYLEEHILRHIVRKHVLRIFPWTFGALLVLELLTGIWDLAPFVEGHMAIVLLLAAVSGLLPTSGPHLIFVALFSQGLIPFSVLLASSVVQDGHGMLPLLSHSPRDVLTVKAIKLVFGLGVGAVLFAIGL